jgi:hypothetical protein
MLTVVSYIADKIAVANLFRRGWSLVINTALLGESSIFSTRPTSPSRLQLRPKPCR